MIKSSRMPLNNIISNILRLNVFKFLTRFMIDS